jgi:hypothetical protein
MEEESIMTAEYTYIILGLLRKHKSLSVVKIALFSYLIKKQKYYRDPVYLGNNSTEVVFKSISLLAGMFEDYCENQKYIIEALHLLIINNDIEIKNDLLSAINVTLEIENMDNKFIDNAIEESKKYTDRQIMKEIVTNV